MERVLKVVGFCSIALLQSLCVASDYYDESDYSSNYDSDYDENNAPEDTRTLEELEQCPCVQEYVFQKYGEDLTASAKQQKKKKKKKKKTKGQNNRSSYNTSSEYEEDFAENQESSLRDDRGSSNKKNKNGTAKNKDHKQKQGKAKDKQNKNNNDKKKSGKQKNGSSSSKKGKKNSSSNNWMNETAWMNLKNPFASVNLIAQNDTKTSDDSDGKSGIEVLKDLNIDTSSCHNQFALIDQAAKESEKLAASQILIVR